jgi:FMN-dependent NADH-azoreductase
MNLLRIDSSPYGETAISRLLTEEFVQRWLSDNAGGAVISRDLNVMAIPVVDPAWVTANYTPTESRTHAQEDILRFSANLTGELTDADELVIGLPIHNWGPPSIFKRWVDQIVTPAALKARPLVDKRVTFLIAAGRNFGPGSPDAKNNYVVPWLRTVFGSLGASDMQHVLADCTRKVHSGDLDRASFLAPHREAIRALFIREQAAIGV